MGVTNFDNINAGTSRFKVVATLPVLPEDYYGTSIYDVANVEWGGGETCYLSVDNRIYIQTATSGRTPTWKRLLTQFATTTSTSTSTSTSSTSSSSSSTSSSSTTTMA